MRILAGKISLHFWDYKINWFPLFWQTVCDCWWCIMPLGASIAPPAANVKFSFLLKTLKNFQVCFLYIHSNNTKLIELGGYVSFFFQTFFKKKLKLLRKFRKAIPKNASWIQPKWFFLKYFTVDFFFQQYSTNLEHTRK